MILTQSKRKQILTLVTFERMLGNTLVNTFPAVQRLRVLAPTAGDTSSVLGWGTRSGMPRGAAKNLKTNKQKVNKGKEPSIYPDFPAHNYNSG